MSLYCCPFIFCVSTLKPEKIETFLMMKFASFKIIVRDLNPQVPQDSRQKKVMNCGNWHFSTIKDNFRIHRHIPKIVI